MKLIATLLHDWKMFWYGIRCKRCKSPVKPCFYLEPFYLELNHSESVSLGFPYSYVLRGSSAEGFSVFRGLCRVWAVLQRENGKSFRAVAGGGRNLLQKLERRYLGVCVWVGRRVASKTARTEDRLGRWLGESSRPSKLSASQFFGNGVWEGYEAIACMASYFMCGATSSTKDTYSRDLACVLARERIWPWGGHAAENVKNRPQYLFLGWRRGAVAESSAPFSVCALFALCLDSALFACLVFAMFVWSLSAFVVVDCFLLIVFYSCLWYRFDLEYSQWIPSGLTVDLASIWVNSRFLVSFRHIPDSHQFQFHLSLPTHYCMSVCYEFGFHRCVWVLLSYQHDQHDFKLNCLAFIWSHIILLPSLNPISSFIKINGTHISKR